MSSTTSRYRRTTTPHPWWKKPSFHFSLCFTIGLFTGFTPSNFPSTSSSSSTYHLHSFQETLQFPPDPILQTPNLQTKIQSQPSPLPPPPPPPPPPLLDLEDDDPGRRLLIFVTTTRSGNQMQEALLGRLARTLRLVPPPLLWIVVEAQGEGAKRIDEKLGRTGILYRHLTFTENFTDPEAEVHHQRNVALSHLEYHRISGIVHFAGVSNVYDLRFFNEIRKIESFGVWPVVIASANKEPEVRVEGPVCRSSRVTGWYVKDIGNNIVYEQNKTKEVRSSSTPGIQLPSPISIWGFAFNSSVLWDPERWGRPTSIPDTSQDSMGFIQQVIMEDETKLKAIPSDCSMIMLWHLHIPREIPIISGGRQRR